jgi:hypothetical protein
MPARCIDLRWAFSILRLSGTLDSVKERLDIAWIVQPRVGRSFGAAGRSGAVRICRIFTLYSLRIAFSRHAFNLS